MLVALAAGAPFARAAASQEPPVPPDAPRPAPVEPGGKPLPTNYEVKRPVELRSVLVGRVTKERSAAAGPEFLKSAKEPIFIEVTTAPGVLGKPAAGAAPLIVLNGERLLSTRSAGTDKLIAFLPSREPIRETNTVAVVWLGKQEPTMTKAPLTFSRGDVKE
jgi:hypothetical protein